MEERKAEIRYDYDDWGSLPEELEKVITGEKIWHASEVTLETPCLCSPNLSFDPGDTAPMRKEIAEEIDI